MSLELRSVTERHELCDSCQELGNYAVIDGVQEFRLQSLIRQQSHDWHLLGNFAIELIQGLHYLTLVLIRDSLLALLYSLLIIDEIFVDAERHNHIVDGFTPLLLVEDGPRRQDVRSGLVLNL